MEKEPFIFGKNLAPELAEDARESLKQLRKEALQPLEGELEKTPEELKFIGKINEYIAEEFEELRLKDLPSVASAKEGKPYIFP